MKDSGFGSFLAGVVIGGLVGAAIGLLLAPDTGERMREQVADFVDEKRSQIGDSINEGRQAAEQARAEMAAGAADVLILDEINNAFRFGLLEPGPVIEALAARPPELTVVLTGRGAPPEILDAADLVTEMAMRKHPYQRGIPALYGIDF